MKKTLLLLSLATTLLVACNKPDNPIPNGGMPLPTHIDPSYKVGDYFHNDTLEGVVFYTYNDYNGLMVSLEETKLPWCDSAHILSETGATNPYDGWNNTNIVTANYDLYYFPTISWSYRRNTWHHVHYPHKLISSRQWYVPSSTEMRYLLMNQEAVNATLDSLGYPTLENRCRTTRACLCARPIGFVLQSWAIQLWRTKPIGRAQRQARVVRHLFECKTDKSLSAIR